MDEKIARFYQLKKQHKEIEQEMADLRGDILTLCSGLDVTERDAGDFRVKLIGQERREYDDQKLYNALPDASVWRLLSKADATKIAALIKLNVISEEVIRETYTIKKVTLLQVERK
ncbi:hypothetical protein ACFPVX_08625 [Cohnella faecalis]|uniref:Uncharacterized protein n=1 Tax=Cohnella faecalis TaxID=2315694 RepID=A0A398CKI2_9BACL|nr:hypothetical protein [Cohnella faecalis]RIE03223.1 hypothetical protein D3H35_20645 [Cohnella faecalis]